MTRQIFTSEDVLARLLGLEPTAEGLFRLPTMLGEEMPPEGDDDEEGD